MSRFNLGRVTASEAAVQFCKDNGLSMVIDIIFRHSLGDWGDAPEAQKEANDDALANGGQLVSIYAFTLGKIRVYTDAERTVTYLMTDDEYLKATH